MEKNLQEILDMSEGLQSKIDSELAKLYDMASIYLEDSGLNEKNVVDYAAQIYVATKGVLPTDKIKMVLRKCLTYSKMDFDEPMRLEEYTSGCEELLEDITGYIGEYLE